MEIKRNFVGGAMNKDLDERLVPQGYYRDAQNIEIVTSEGSNVGSVQNVLGNQERKNKSVNVQWSSEYISDLSNATCIGSIANEETNKIYWFIASDNVSAIAEYDTSLDQVKPILIDKNSVLNFSSNYLITGINIIDNLLFWTDNQYEPKKINIDQCRAFHANTDNNANNFNTHTQIDEEAFKEEHITVIKQSPLSAPTLTMSQTARDGKIGILGNPISIAPGNYDFYSGGKLLKTNDSTTFTVDEYPDAWLQGDVITLTHYAVINEVVRPLVIRGIVNSITPTTSNQFNVEIRILSIDSRIPNDTTVIYECVLEEDDPMYKLKFVRFAYRYKYKDSEYSCFSPFSEVAFIPGLFDYRPITGNNLGMENTLRELTLTFPDIVENTSPNNVESIDILYKESDNNNVRIVNTLKRAKDNDGNLTIPTTFTIKREILKSLVESSQLLRPFDNVPKKAKAQEVIGNRIVYGNYTQNYDLDQDVKINANQKSIEIIESQVFTADGSTRKFTLDSKQFDEPPTQGVDIRAVLDGTELSIADHPRQVHTDNAGNTFVFFDDNVASGSLTLEYDKKNRGTKSVKSQRNYQLGIVYQDKYGRQSPVFTSQDASVFIEKQSAANKNKLVADVLSKAPSWATHYKWFIKEGANEYYNLVLDGFYPAEDGNVWLAFPSSEINKITEGSYIELKKKHNSADVVKEKAQFKILSVSKEVPDIIAYDQVLYQTFTGLSEATFEVGNRTIQFKGPSNSADLDEALQSPLNVFRFKATINNETRYTQYYPSSTSHPQIGASSNTYILDLQYALDNADSFMADITGASEFELEVYRKEERKTSSLLGRFFAKIENNDTFDHNIRIPAPGLGSEWKTKYSFPSNGVIAKEIQSLFSTDPKVTWRSSISGRTTTSVNRPNALSNYGTNLHTHPTEGSQYFALTFFNIVKNIATQDSNDEIKNKIAQAQLPVEFEFLKKLKPGAYIRFTKGTTVADTVYKIVNNGFEEYKDRWNSTYVTNQNQNFYFVREWKIEQVDAPSLGFNGDFDYDNTVNEAIESIQIVNKEEVLETLQTRIDKPAIFETEPVDIAELDLFHEATNAITILKVNTFELSSTSGSAVIDANNKPKIINIDEEERKIELNQNISNIGLNETLTFTDTVNGFKSTVTTSKTSAATTNNEGNTEIIIETGGHTGTDTLDWFNCFTFGNGVESNRIRDDFNQVVIDKGPKVSTILEQVYKEEVRKASLIYSGIYLNKNTINDTNQFLIAEKITKDLNPEYGSIQKLKARDSNLISCNEDKIINIVANKDAIFNADGNPQLIASTNVLGQAVPYVGEYGISKNPESFVSYAYRSYFTDKARGVVLRLSRDGLTDISAKGMSDYFGDSLAASTTLIGSYNESKDEYILTLNKTTPETVAFSEMAGESGGWTSFRSYAPESGLTINDVYYTFKNGLLYSHDNETRNTFYTDSAVQSSINVIFNESSEVIKSFKTLAYEGSQQRKYRYLGTIDSVTYTADDNLTIPRIIELTPTAAEINALTSEERQKGWYLDSITTDLQSGSIQEFIGKENKFYNHLRGDSLTDANLDESEFSVQGLGTATVSDAGSQTNADVEIIIEGLNANKLKINGVPTGYSSTADNTFVKAFSTGSNLNAVSIEINLDPIDEIKNTLINYNLPSSLTVSGNAEVTAYDSTTGIATLTLTTAGTVLATGHSETITITSPAQLIKSSLSGIFRVIGNNFNTVGWRDTDGNTLNVARAIDVNYGTILSEENQQVKIAEGTVFTFSTPNNPQYAFGELGSTGFIDNLPKLQVNTKGDENGSYDIVIKNKIRDNNSALIRLDIELLYTFGNVKTDITGDSVDIICKTQILLPDFSSDPRIRSISLYEKLDDGSYRATSNIIPNIGGIRYLRVVGDFGAKFGINRSSTAATHGVKLNGTASNITSESITISTNSPISGTLGVEYIKVEYPDNSALGDQYFSQLDFTVTGSYLSDTIYEVPGSSPVSHVRTQQHGMSTLALTFVSSDYDGAGNALTDTHVSIFADDDLDYVTTGDADNSFNAAAEDLATTGIVTSAQTFHEPNISTNNAKRYVPFKYVIDPGGSDDYVLSKSAEASDWTFRGNNGGSAGVGFDDDFETSFYGPITTTLETGSGGANTKLTVTGMLIIEKYGDGTSSTGYAGSPRVELELNIDDLTEKTASTTSYAVALYDCTSLFFTGTYVYIHPSTVCVSGSTATTTCDISTLTNKFIRLRNIGLGCSSTESVGKIISASSFTPQWYASGGSSNGVVHYTTLSNACGSLSGTECT